jgi:hypothetical protein
MAELDPNAAVADSAGLESLMVRVADEFIDRLNRGEQPDVEDYAARHVSRPGAPGLGRTLLGFARYRTGEWQAAVQSLEKGLPLWNHAPEGDAWPRLFLAMANWQLGAKTEARTWYDRAERWFDQHRENADPEWRYDDLRRARAEAAALLGIADAARTKPAAKEK